MLARASEGLAPAPDWKRDGELGQRLAARKLSELQREMHTLQFTVPLGLPHRRPDRGRGDRPRGMYTYSGLGFENLTAVRSKGGLGITVYVDDDSQPAYSREVTALFPWRRSSCA